MKVTEKVRCKVEDMKMLGLEKHDAMDRLIWKRGIFFRSVQIQITDVKSVITIISFLTPYRANTVNTQHVQTMYALPLKNKTGEQDATSNHTKHNIIYVSKY